MSNAYLGKIDMYPLQVGTICQSAYKRLGMLTQTWLFFLGGRCFPRIQPVTSNHFHPVQLFIQFILVWVCLLKLMRGLFLLSTCTRSSFIHTYCFKYTLPIRLFNSLLICSTTIVLDAFDWLWLLCVLRWKDLFLLHSSCHSFQST